MRKELLVSEGYTAEKELTSILQTTNQLNSFCNDILTSPMVTGGKFKEKIAEEDATKYKNYSGLCEVQQQLSTQLASFFYIARIADSKKDDYQKKQYIEQTLNTNLGYNYWESTSPVILRINKTEFDTKPQSQNWNELPDYIKDNIYTYRQNIKLYSNKISNAIVDCFKRLNISCPLNEAELTFKNNFFSAVSQPYNSNVSAREEFLKIASLAGNTINPITQAQVNCTPYIQGYLMNSLLFNNSITNVKNYYQKAIDNKMGLLSGPSGTAFRIMCLVKEALCKWDENIALKTTALCLATLGYPYNCHSYYEIVTVVMPDQEAFYSSVDGISKFKTKMIEKKLIK